MFRLSLLAVVVCLLACEDNKQTASDLTAVQDAIQDGRDSGTETDLAADSAADTLAPDTLAPDTLASDAPPDTQPPDTQSPDTQSPDTQPPDTQPPDTQPPDTTATCPSVAPTAAHYVDPVLGVDDVTHGGAPSACAYKTIPYALSQATGEVHLASATYVLTETIELIGSQGIVCAANTTLKGQPTFSTGKLAVKISGDGNRLSNCKIEGDDSTGYCLDIWGDNAEVTNTSISLCGGMSVRVVGDNSHFAGNTIAPSSGIVGMGYILVASSHLINNTFVGTTWATDISCVPNCSLTGSGNTSDGNPAKCSAGCNCPPTF